MKTVAVYARYSSHKQREESIEEQVNGRYEFAIRRLEKAQEFLPKEMNQAEWQTYLFFNSLSAMLNVFLFLKNKFKCG